ncbi:hypothetical protein ACFXG6_19425 [Streptomyces roseus]|uniref:hypothetical protein n=1 Tax=Streptomyces roseus TaxID=66430 RepID=UPI003692D1F2
MIAFSGASKATAQPRTRAYGSAEPARAWATGFSWLSPWLMTRRAGLAAYGRMTEDPRFRAPLPYAEVDPARLAGLFVPGGHAQGMRTPLEDPVAQRLFARVLLAGLPVGAVCHGVLPAARAQDPATGRSVLYGRRTTALTSLPELTAWNLTRLWLGRYYRTYAATVQAEATAALAEPGHFLAGPPLPVRDTAARPGRGFTVRTATTSPRAGRATATAWRRTTSRWSAPTSTAPHPPPRKAGAGCGRRPAWKGVGRVNLHLRFRAASGLRIVTVHGDRATVRTGPPDADHEDPGESRERRRASPRCGSPSPPAHEQ